TRELDKVVRATVRGGVSVASGDGNGDNFDDLIVSAGKGREPIVTALDGQQIAAGDPNPDKLFTFVAGGGPAAGARVAVGYVAPRTLPGYPPNPILTPQVCPHARPPPAS